MRYLAILNPLTMILLYFVMAPVHAGYRKVKCTINPNCPECAIN